MRTIAAILLMTLLPLAVNSADKAKPVEFEIKNELAFDRGLTLVAHPVELSGKKRLLCDGKELACHYDAKQKKLLFLDTFAKGETKKYQVLQEEPKAKMPAFTTKTGKDGEVKFGKKTLKGANGEISNGLLTVKAFRNKELRAEVEITGGAYKFRCNPLGNAIGCIDDKKLAEELDKSPGKPHPQLMTVFFGTPEKITFEEVNPFQRKMKVACTPFAHKNNDESPEIVSESSIEITLTWQSPVVEIKSHRKVAKTFYNHNGFYLNEFYVSQFPVDVFLDGANDAKTLNVDPKGAGVPDVGAKKFLLVKHSEDNKEFSTIIAIPDFEKNSIEGARVSAFKDRMMTVVSQSWHQGWKPIEIKAQDYDDRLVLICDIAATLKPDGKTYANWVEEGGA